MSQNAILLLFNKDPRGIPGLQNDCIISGWLAWFNLCTALPRWLRVLQMKPTVCESLSDWSGRKAFLVCVCVCVCVSANSCMFEAFEEESWALMLCACVYVCTVAHLCWLFPSSVLHGFASHWQSLSAKETTLSELLQKAFGTACLNRNKSISFPSYSHCTKSNGKDKQWKMKFSFCCMASPLWRCIVDSNKRETHK